MSITASSLVARVSGLVSEQALRIEAWDADALCADLLDVASTDLHGSFEMLLDPSYVAALVPIRAPKVAFRIFHNGKSIAEAKAVTWELDKPVTHLVIPLTNGAVPGPPLSPAPSVVRGTISRGNGTPAANIVVRAFDRNLGPSGFADAELGHATTSADGRYEIKYSMTNGKLKPDLIVRAYRAAPATAAPTAALPTAVAAESQLISTAPTVAFVNLGLDGIVAPLASDHRVVSDAVKPVLDRSKLALADLKPEHITYVAGAAEIDTGRLGTMIDAAQLSRDSGGKIDAEIAFALLAGGYQGDLDGLVEQRTSTLRGHLDRAIDDNTISRAFAPQLDTIVAGIRDAAVARALPAQGATVYSAALANALAPADVHEAFLRAYLDRDGSGADFWDAVRADTKLAPHADDLETTMRLQVLFGGFQPALAELRARRQAGTITSHRDLARWQDSEWQSFLAKTGTPPETPGDTPAAKATAYATALARVARASFPTEYLRGRAAQASAPLSLKFLPALAAANPTLDLRRPLPDSPSWGTIAEADRPAAAAEWTAFQRQARAFRDVPARTLLASTTANRGVNPIREAANRVLLAAKDLDLENVTVDQYLSSHETALAGVPAEHKLGVIGYLKGVQRLLRVVRQPELVDDMLGDGVDSALRIARMPRLQFADRYQSKLGGSSAAAETYQRAIRVASVTQLGLTTVAQQIAGTSPWALRGGSRTTFEAPNYARVLDLLHKTAKEPDPATWPSLFGSDSWCDCDECSSAWGPAAYFVDLVHSIDPEDKNHTPADKLFERRADLQYLPLTCDNTNTPIPTIDLVNEILELRVAKELELAVDVKSYDNTGISADVLRAVPQNVLSEVYLSTHGKSSLASEVYPFTLPFHRPLAVVRTYLDQLGASYRDVLDAFGLRDAVDGMTHAERLAAEDLSLSHRSFNVIAEQASDVTVDDAYGHHGDASWRAQPILVTDLLLRTGVTYDDLYALTWTYFLRGGAPTGKPELETPRHCQIEGTHLNGATDDTWTRLHRFIRLQRATGWSIEDLDRVLFALGADPQTHVVTLGHDQLRMVGEAKRTIAALDQPLAAVLTLWSDIDTWGSDSLYLQRFVNPTVAKLDTDPNGDAAQFVLDHYDPAHPERKPVSGGFEPAGKSDTLEAHRAHVLSALGITSADFDLIWNHAISQHWLKPEAAPTLTLRNLTALFRYTVLAQGLELRISDLVTLLVLSGKDPFTTPSETLDFITLAKQVAASGLSIPALDYIYRHTILPGQGPAPSDGVVASALVQVWTALRAVRQDTAVTDDPDATLLAKRLATFQPTSVVATIIAALDPTLGATDDPVATRTRRQQVIDLYVTPTLASAPQVLFGTPDPVRPVAPADPSDPAYEAALAQYVTDAATRKRTNQTALLTLVSAWLRDSLSQTAVVSTVASTLGVSDAISRRLLVDWIPGDGNQTALETMLALEGGGLTPYYFTEPDHTGTKTVGDASIVSAQVTADSSYRSVRWIGRLLPTTDGKQRIVVRTQGKVTITVGSQTQTSAATPSVTDRPLDVSLAANQLATIQIDYDAGLLAGQIELLWSVASGPTPQPIPAENLFPENGLAVLDGTSGPGYAWRRAHKASLLLDGMSLTEEELDYAQSVDAPFGAFALSALPMTAVTDATTAFATWRALASFVAVRASLPASDTSLVDVLTWISPGARLEEWSQQLCNAGGWDVATVKDLLHPHGVDWTKSGTTIVLTLLQRVSDKATIGERLAALQACIALVKRVGADPSTLQAWAKDQPDASVADQVIQAVRAWYQDDTEWLSVAQTRNDTLRQLQRDALVAFLMPRILIDKQPPIDVNSLFEHFLIDIEMCPCGQTSRVKQAISSVQLFIQRILLDLESGIPSTYIDPKQWEWNSEYRIWQANREIFLYPENWIDPELRVDESPFFADLRSQLSQGPLDSDHVEDAFLSYLEKLEDVARLDVCAVHWQQETSHDPNPLLAAERTIDTLHVVARTPGAQPTYYYRTLLDVGGGNGGSEWTAWQKIDVDIQGDGDTGDVHMVLTTYNRRLYLFWAQFTEVPETTQPGADTGESPPPPLTHWEVRLAWSTYREGTWSAKQVTSEHLSSDRFMTDDKSDRKAFASALDDYQHDLDKARSAAEAAAKAAKDAEDSCWSLFDEFVKEAVKIVTDYMDAHNKSGVSLLDPTAFYSKDQSALDKWLSQNGVTFEKLISENVKFVNGLDTGTLSMTKDQLDKRYQTYIDAKDTNDSLQAKYQTLAKAMADFNSGLGSLAVASFTQRKDHTLWHWDKDGTVSIYLLRHDDTITNPRIIGTFDLSADGRSVTATSSSSRISLPHQMPHHSSPKINAFQVDTSKHDGLDLDGLPDLLGKATKLKYYDEHWFSHSVTSDEARPFFVAKQADLDVALPGMRSTDGSTSSGSSSAVTWHVAIPTSPKTGKPVSSSLDQIAEKTNFGLSEISVNPPKKHRRRLFRFESFQHPFIETLIKRLERDGVDGLLTIATQTPGDSDEGGANGHFDTTFAPSHKFVSTPYARYDVDFRAQGAYAAYNWEVFFHAPMLIAARLMTDARYEDARTWLHYIFDPTTSSHEPAPDRYWNVQWFRDHKGGEDAERLMTVLADNSPDGEVDRIQAEIDQWTLHPADPHRIARLRTSAYQKAIVFKYLDNLIAWGDSLFTQNTIESINQATQLYVLASHLLGPRPQHVPQPSEIPTFCYDDLRGNLDRMSDTVEGMLHPEVAESKSHVEPEVKSLYGIPHLPVVFPSQHEDPSKPQGPLVFCVPANSKLLGYFETIDDRLFKIRNCMNIEGVVQQLPLFEPPIDPALLVRAAAMGLDVASIISDLSSPLPFQRFTVTAGKANELVSELRALGGALLMALEKQDAEALALLRATNESALVTAVRDVKKQAVTEAQTNKDALEKARIVTQAKLDYYASREFMNDWEEQQQSELVASRGIQIASGTVLSQSSEAAVVPSWDIGPTGMGVHGAMQFGGANFSSAMRAIAESLGMQATSLSASATMAGILGGHHRRQDEWDFQKDVATKELAQIDKQLAAADIRLAIANLDLNNQQLQIDNAQKIQDTLRTKYTNTELYQWMVGQVSTTYYGAYKLAYDLAKRAERCYQYELGIPTSSYIQFGYWDSLHKGLLAGDQLALDLKRLETAYLQNNRRDYEISRQVSLVLHDPIAFMTLRDTGSCTFDLPEELFDADYPGHYFRRIKNVSLTLPCVAGPYTPINCTLTLLSSCVRTAATATGTYVERDAPNDARFSHAYGSIQSVATSHGQNDAGLFEVSFRDERYLPFEGAGAISRWRIDLPQDCNAFDFDTLADVVIKLAYTARDGGAQLSAAARSSLASARKATTVPAGKTALERMFRVRYEFSDAWIAFRNAAASGAASLALTIDRDRFPYAFRGAKTLTIGKLDVYATSSAPLSAFDVRLAPPGAGSPAAAVHLKVSHSNATLVHGTWSATQVAVKSGADATWTLSVDAGSPLASVRDVVVVVTYTVA